MNLLIGIIIGIIIGAFLGGYLVYRFNVPDTVINGKNRAKKGGVINFKAIAQPKQKLFKRIFTKNK